MRREMSPPVLGKNDWSFQKHQWKQGFTFGEWSILPPIMWWILLQFFSFFFCSFFHSFWELKSLVQIFIKLDWLRSVCLGLTKWQNMCVCVCYPNFDSIVDTHFHYKIWKVSNFYIMRLIKVKFLDTLSVVYSIKTINTYRT